MMRLELVPLLSIQRELYRIPAGPGRFRAYLRTILDERGEEPTLPPLVAMNPMGKPHVAERLDQLVAMDAEGVARRALAEATEHPSVAGAAGSYKVGLVVVDDRGGGWTNRWAVEFVRRFGVVGRDYGWMSAMLWTNGPMPDEETVRCEVLEVVHRTVYVAERGPSRTLGERMEQEGEVMQRAGSVGPCLELEDMEYTRAVIGPELGSVVDRVAIECLFGDEAAASLGMTRRGLSAMAGLALARHEAFAGANRLGKASVCRSLIMG